MFFRVWVGCVGFLLRPFITLKLTIYPLLLKTGSATATLLVPSSYMPTDLWLLGLLFLSVFGGDSQQEGDWPLYSYEDSIYIIIPIIF
jgi:hypothetical protein